MKESSVVTGGMIPVTRVDKAAFLKRVYTLVGMGIRYLFSMWLFFFFPSSLSYKVYLIGLEDSSKPEIV